MRTLMTWNPASELRAVEEAMERLFGSPRNGSNGSPATMLPVDVLERDGKFIVKAAVPGLAPDQLDVQIEKNVLTIKGEHRCESEDADTKVYRREVAYGSFARSIRLPENLNLDSVEAEFSNGIVTISIAKVEEPKPLSIKVNVRPSESA